MTKFWDPKRCQKQVWIGSWYSQCRRKGSVEEDGKLWCKQHTPSAEAARLEASNKRQEEKWKESARKSRAAAWDLVISQVKRDEPALAEDLGQLRDRYVNLEG